MMTKQEILAALAQPRGGFVDGKRLAQDPEGRAVLLEIARDAGSAERVAAADASLAERLRCPWVTRRDEEAGWSIVWAIKALADEGLAPPPVLFRALGDPHHYVRYEAVCALQWQIPVHEAQVFLRAEARYGSYKATQAGLEALTTAEDLRALIDPMEPDDLQFAVQFLSFEHWSAPLQQEACRLLRELLHHPDGRVRASAALTHPDEDDPAVRAALLDALRVPEPWIRWVAIARLAHDPAAHPLIRAALRDPDPRLRLAASDSFAGVDEPTTREILGDAGGDPPDPNRSRGWSDRT
ncbi:HEAT repeat domain-containing protein [Sorangium sp. So ce426]|uniref:HEAT repeat domain-containing protein n=1 Tax=unclassified Sorangium TaxID=2621164 RepID=UPI003F5BB9DE